MRRMLATPAARNRWQGVFASAFAGALAAAGMVLVVSGAIAQAGPPQPDPGATSPADTSLTQPAGQDDAIVVPAADATPTGTQGGTAHIDPLPRSVPVSLDIPAIGVHTRLMRLGLHSDGTVAVPPLGRHAPAGWYRYLSTPGEPGPAVVLGHVDSARDGPAVFYRLGQLRPGQRLSVRRADGRIAGFTIRKVASYPKADFPSAAVYGRASGSELRLVTCGGTFDHVKHHYRDNIVVFAVLTSTTRG